MVTESNSETSLEKQNWLCPLCGNENGNYNAYCEYCKDEKIIFNPDKYYIRDIRIRHISEGHKLMTPQEELFSELFNHEKVLVKDMDVLTLRAHREELAKIAFEARARLTAVDDEERGRRKTEHEVRGFERSVNIDEATSEVINTIKERQKRMSKMEKIQAGLEKLGITSSDAAKLMSAGVILSRIKSKASEEVKEEKVSETKLFNPFKKISED